MEEEMDKKEVDLLGSLESETNKVESATDSYLGALDQLSTVDHGMKSVNAFAEDVVALANGVVGRSPENLDWNKVRNYLELLSNEAERIESGIYAKDNSILYTSPDGISFDKEESKTL